MRVCVCMCVCVGCIWVCVWITPEDACNDEENQLFVKTKYDQVTQHMQSAESEENSAQFLFGGAVKLRTVNAATQTLEKIVFTYPDSGKKNLKWVRPFCCGMLCPDRGWLMISFLQRATLNSISKQHLLVSACFGRPWSHATFLSVFQTCTHPSSSLRFFLACSHLFQWPHATHASGLGRVQWQDKQVVC